MKVRFEHSQGVQGMLLAILGWLIWSLGLIRNLQFLCWKIAWNLVMVVMFTCVYTLGMIGADQAWRYTIVLMCTGKAVLFYEWIKKK